MLNMLGLKLLVFITLFINVYSQGASQPIVQLDDLKIEATWRLSGTHYEKTSLAWLKNMDDNRSFILKIFEKTYGEENSGVWFQRWRIFFMSCEKLFGYNSGKEWGVSHYRFTKN